MVFKVSALLIESAQALDEIMYKFNHFEKNSDFVYSASSAVFRDVISMWQNKLIDDVELYLFLQVFECFLKDFRKLM